MIGSIVALVIKAGVPKEAAKTVTFVLFAAVVLLLLWGAKCAYDSSIRDDALDDQELETLREDRKADAVIEEQRREDQARLQQEAEQLRKVEEDASTTDLERRLARHRCLRLQQAARTNGLEPPACV